jgi:hypothetical protein
MRFVRTILFALLLSFAVFASSRGVAAPFVNLNFEQATVVPSNEPFIDAAAAFPGWTGRFNDFVLSDVSYNTPGIGSPILALYDRPVTDLGIALLEGQYMALFVPGTPQARVSLSQTGDVPSDALSIRFKTGAHLPPPSLYFNNEPLPIVRLGGGTISFEVATYGADVAAFAGSTVLLRLDSGSGSTLSQNAVDDVTFSSIPIPEPISIMAIALVVLLRRARANPSVRYPD